MTHQTISDFLGTISEAAAEICGTDVCFANTKTDGILAAANYCGQVASSMDRIVP